MNEPEAPPILLTPPNFVAHSRAISNQVNLPIILGAPVSLASRADLSKLSQVVIGWGLKPSSARAAQFAAEHGLPFWRVEDGFLRSVDLGKDEPPLSLVLDDLGIYYDATSPSRLEKLVARQLSAPERRRAINLIAAWQAARVSKYNHLREYQGSLPGSFVLVVDQTAGDASIRYGLADPSSFARMLAAALSENPECTVLLKIHPEVMAGYKRGHFDPGSLTQQDRVQILGDDVHPAALLQQAKAVYTVSSQMGFEGLLWGKRVRSFGMPFYAGWGLTEDELPSPQRRTVVSLENLVHAALIDYPRYLDPETGLRCEAERLIEWLALQRRMRERFPSNIDALGFSRWKKPIVRDFCQGSKVRFVRHAGEVPSGGTLAVWGRKPVRGNLPDKVSLIRLEDGFLRSVGLGADLVRPLSWVMDQCGIYYDATRPSALEILLENTDFDEDLCRRAGALREVLCRAGLTKYNVGAPGWHRPVTANRIILVPGQVESDASIRYGAPAIRTNIGLLKAVRASNSAAYVVYKPHPDVVAGLRAKGKGEEAAAGVCDEILTDVAMGALLEEVDEVHTLTSLAGFEALLRGKRVVTFGQPFYSGWGLTEDHVSFPRRTRTLTLDELVAGVLLLYPVYLSRQTGRFTTPERALQELLDWREEGPATLPLWRKGWRLMMRLGGKQ